MDGDPAVFNGLAEEATACVKAGVSFEVVPGVSSVTAVPSYAGVPLTSASSTGVHVLVAGARGVDLTGALDPKVTVVVIGAPDKAAQTFDALIAAGRDGATPVAVTERGTSTDQRTVTTTLSSAGATMADGRFPVLAVVGSTVTMRETLSWFESKPLFGWEVLVPRTKEQSASTLARLQRHGAQAKVVPTISVEPPRTPQQLERAVKGMVTGRYEWVGFTSVNAVRAIREKFDEFGLDARSFAGLRVAAVGGVTAQALRDWGITPDLVPTGEQSALGLLEVWPAFDPDLDPIARVFLPRADIATETLVAVGGRRRHGLPHGAGGPAAGVGARRHQERLLRRRAVHVELDRAQPRRYRGQAAPDHGRRLHRPGHGQDRGRARPAGRRARPGRQRRRARRRPGRSRPLAGPGGPGGR